MTKFVNNKVLELIDKIQSFLLFSERYQVKKYINDVNNYFIIKNVKEICSKLKLIINRLNNEQLLSLFNNLESDKNIFEKYVINSGIYSIRLLEDFIRNIHIKIIDIKDILERSIS